MKFDLQRFADGNVDGSGEQTGETVEGGQTMSKSYTLADGSTVTVTATEQGIPFNEGMQALTKAIKARVNVRDGSSGSGGSSGKLVPTLSVTNTEAYYGEVTYNGDGELTAYYCSNNTLAETSIDTIAGNQLTIPLGDGNQMNGIIVASEGEKYSPAWSMFTVTGSGPT